MAQNPNGIGSNGAGTMRPQAVMPNVTRPLGANGDSNGVTNGGYDPLDDAHPLFSSPGELPEDLMDETEAAVDYKLSLEEVYIDELLAKVVELGGSDLHLAVGKPPCVRVHGKVLELDEYEIIKPSVIQRMIYDILTDEQIQRYENELELDFAYTAQHVARFRVNAFRDRTNVAAAMRVIPSVIPSASDLNLPPVILDLANRPRGLMLVTGPTGSGKSTTLAAVIDQINRQHDGHILTIEDPIEFVHEHKRCVVNQREVGTDTKSFAAALRSALREDPDTILVGEMRDNETIHLAITAAETGHLVFGTLHTNSAAESVDRMVGVFPADQQEQIRTQLSNSIVAIVSQQLLPKTTGGRVAAIEIMIANSAIRNLIREAKAHQMVSIIQTHNSIGMQTMDQALRDLYHKGQITYDDAIARSHNAAELEVMMLNRSEEATR